MPQVRGGSERIQTFEQIRRAHRDDGLREELVHVKARVGPAAQTDRRVESFAIEVHDLEAGRDPHVDVRMSGVESLQTRYQPLRRERGGHAHVQGTARVMSLLSVDRLGEPVESLAESGKAGLASVGEQERVAHTPKELHAQVALEPFHLVADCRGRDVQLASCLREAEVPARGLKRPECIERW